MSRSARNCPNKLCIQIGLQFHVSHKLFYLLDCLLRYVLFVCDVPCIVCVYMCTEQLPPRGYPIAVKYIISYHIISYHIISYHIISYHIISYHIISYIISYHVISYHITCKMYHTITAYTTVFLKMNPPVRNM